MYIFEVGFYHNDVWYTVADGTWWYPYQPIPGQMWGKFTQPYSGYNWVERKLDPIEEAMALELLD